MKRIIIVAFFALLLAVGLPGCQNPSDPLHDALCEYSEIVARELPDDLYLTIYYMDPKISTRYPLGKDDLIAFCDDGFGRIEVIEAEELKSHAALFRKLDASALTPVQGEAHINARMYYVLASESSGKILEVIVNDIHGYVFVNGVAVEENPIFFELIKPFLTEEACNLWGIQIE